MVGLCQSDPCKFSTAKKGQLNDIIFAKKREGWARERMERRAQGDRQVLCEKKTRARSVRCTAWP